jgi:hypothetical protein
MANSSDAAVDALLSEEIVPLAASVFAAVFTGVGLGREQARFEVDKELHRRFGKPHGRDAHYAYKAVVMQILLIWERALVAARAHSGVLILLPDGLRLLDTKDVARGLRALL